MARGRAAALGGFAAAAVLGTLGHFAWNWSGGSVVLAAFCPVNESTWEHMKLLFFPVFFLTAVQTCAGWRQGDFLAARGEALSLGLGLIPVLFYTYSGVLGYTVMWVDILIFYLSAGAVFLLEGRLLRRRAPGPAGQLGALLWLWLLAFLFVWWTFRPPRLGLWQDPVTGGFGLIG